MTSEASTSQTHVHRRKHFEPPDEDFAPEPLSKLVSWNELFDWQKDNHYIHSGYVRATNSIRASLASLLYLHNETGNIYSHLIPSLLYLFVTLATLDYFIPVFDSTSWKDHAFIITFCIGCISCLGLSSTFHCLKSHSSTVMAFGNKLDYLGIVILIETSMIPMIYYGLYGFTHLQQLFWSLTSTFGIICATVSLKDKFRTPDWRSFRASMFVAYGLCGVLPIISGIFVLGLHEAAKRSQLPWLLLEAFLYISGATIYACRVPERFWPGKFDIWGHSHQIFHILVVLAACSHARGLLNAYEYAHSSVIPPMI